jgi:hypothetical protein
LPNFDDVGTRKDLQEEDPCHGLVITYDFMGRQTIPNDPSFFALRRNNDFPLSGISPVVEGEAPAQKKTVSNGRQSFVNHYSRGSETSERNDLT